MLKAPIENTLPYHSIIQPEELTKVISSFEQF